MLFLALRSRHVFLPIYQRRSIMGGAPWPSAISKILAAGYGRSQFRILCRRGLQRGIYPRHLGCHMRPTPLSTPGNTPPTAALSIAVSVHPGTTASFLEDLSLCDVRHVLVRKPLVRLRECKPLAATAASSFAVAPAFTAKPSTAARAGWWFQPM